MCSNNIFVLWKFPDPINLHNKIVHDYGELNFYVYYTVKVPVFSTFSSPSYKWGEQINLCCINRNVSQASPFLGSLKLLIIYFLEHFD